MRTRSGYSFRTAYGHLEDVVARLVAIGYPVAPISDRYSTFGFTRWTKLAEANGLRPIYGVELAVVPALGEKRPIIDYWTFFATKSLRPLHELIGLATSNPGKEPSVLYEQALAAKELIKITGERTQLEHIKSEKNLYIGLSPSLPKGLFNEAKRRGFKFIATGDNYYPNENDLETYRIALGKRSNTQSYPMHILSDEEWARSVSWVAGPADIDLARRARSLAIKSCVATQKKAKLLEPEKKKTLRQMCIEGTNRTGTDLTDPIYKERLNRELKLIAEKEFENYFYIIADLVQWAKKRMIVGPARGSSCGSLVCYLLNITTIDPIPYGLIFERFIDTTRTDLPDIDIDFSDERRHLVFEYAEQKFGKDHVARLGTVTMFKARSALKQAGIGLRIPQFKIDKVLDGLIERSSADARASDTLEDTLNTTINGKALLNEWPEVIIASQLEAHPNNSSQHAAGIIITAESILEYVAIDNRSGAIMCDKKDAETLNLLKIDALGLTQLSIFERTLELIGKPDRSGWLEKLPLDDELAFEVLNNEHFAGIFQFYGIALQSLTKQVKVTQLEDMIALTALARPGPMATGGANQWIRRRTGKEPVTYTNDQMRALTEATYGVVVYQETVMNIVRKIGQMSWEDTSAIRKAMSGSLGDEFFEKYWIKFRAGALKQKIDEDLARKLWDQINTFGSWAFNRSHAVAYGIVSYWACWLKAHYPVEFAAATLDAERDPGKQIALLRELKEEGVDYVPVDAERSSDRWSVIEKGNSKLLVGPLTAIKGFGPAAMREIIDARKNGLEIRSSLAKRLISARTDIDTLFPVGDTIKRLHPDLAKINIHSKPMSVRDVQCGIEGEIMIFGIAKRIATRDENDEQKVMQRGGKRFTGPTLALNMFFQDDTDEIFCKIDRFKFEAMGRAIVERGGVGKALYAVKGTVPRGFRMISVRRIKYLGDLDGEIIEAEPNNE